jgi:hypothetical protein
MQADQWPVVAILGSGAVGCYFGGMLARSGVRVTLEVFGFLKGHSRVIALADYAAEKACWGFHIACSLAVRNQLRRSRV